MSEYNVEMLVRHIYNCEEQYQALEAELSSLNGMPFSYHKNKKMEIKNKMDRLRNEINKRKQELVDATTFKRKVLSSFLATALTILDKESYVVTKVSSKKDKDLGVSLLVSNLVIGDTFHEMNWNSVTKFGLSDTKLDASKYYLISSEINASVFKKTLESSNLETAISQISDQKIILLDKKKPSLLDGIELHSKFKIFPVLKEIAYRLVDLKLSNPELSDDERLSVVLEGLKNKHK